MNYQLLYDLIILKAKPREIIKGQYYERHHIIPRCLGGNNRKENLVMLTFKEHYVCHHLLCKIYPNNYKIKAAFALMVGSPKQVGKKQYITASMYETVKRELKDLKYPWLVAAKNKPRKRKTTPAWNKGLKMGARPKEYNKKSSETLKQHWANNEHPRKGKPSWNSGKKGLQVAWNKGIKRETTTCVHCGLVGSLNNIKRWHNDNCRNKAE